MSYVILNEWLYPFIARIFYIYIYYFFIHRSDVLTALFGYCMAGATRNCCRLGASSVYTIQLCTSLQCHFIQSHRVYAHLAVTCHRHCWRRDLDGLLRANAVTMTEVERSLPKEESTQRLTMHKCYNNTLCKAQNATAVKLNAHCLTVPLLAVGFRRYFTV